MHPFKRTSPLIAALLFLATAAVTLWQNAHLAVLWDLSYLLDSSYRIALGQMPYRDFPFAHAPLTFLLQAALIHLTGRVYFHHVLYAAFAGATATLLAWRILTAILQDRLHQATHIAALLATPLIFLGIYSIYPHPIYDSDCILAILLAIYLLQRTSTTLRSTLAGAALVPPLFFKQNIGLLFLITALAAIVTIHLTAGLHNYLYWTITFAAQRRLPGLGSMLTIYNQTSLLWTIPSAIAALIILRLRTRWSRPTAILLLASPFLWTIATLPFLSDPSDRADQLLSLWPHLLLLSMALALLNLRRNLTFNSLLPIILLVTIHGTFLSQQLWGSTYSIWPLLTLLIASLLLTIPTIATPLATIITATLLICGSLYTFSHERLSYTQLSGTLVQSTLPQLRGLATPGPWIPAFEELIRDTDHSIPTADTILLFPGQDPFYYTTGRTPRFSILLFDPATAPYSPQQLAAQVELQDVRWLIVNRTLQLAEPPLSNYEDYLRALQSHFVLDHSLTNYDIYRRQ